MPQKRFFRKTLLGLAVCLGLMPAGRGGAAKDPPADLTVLGLTELMDVSVQGASKYEQSILEAPSAVTVVTRNDIKKFGYRTLADILRSARGFFIFFDRNYQYVGVRGFGRPGDYNARVLLLVDGHRLNDAIYDQAPVGTDFPLDIDLIDRVEIIRGPSSSIYGANAFFAVINVITRSGRDLKGIEVSGEGGSFNAYKGRVSFGNRLGQGPEFLFSGSYYNSQGPPLYFREFDSPATKNGIARNCDYDRFASSFAKVSFEDFTLTGVYHSREKGIPTGSFGTIFGDSRTRTLDTRAYLDLKYSRAFGNDWQVLARFSYDHNPYNGFYAFLDTGSPWLRVMNRDSSRNDWWSAELQVAKTLFDRHKIIAGAEYRDYFRMDQANFDEAPFTHFLNDRRTAQVKACYLQDEVTILKNLRLNAGVRYDHYSTCGGSLNPRIALIYHPWPASALKLLYGQAFRAPNAYELYYQDGGNSAKSSPKLKPEKITTYEVVWEQFLGKNYRVAASGYYYHIDDLITQQLDPADGLLVYRNTDKAQAKGLELEVGGKWARGWEARLSYALQEAKNVQTGKLLSNSPMHLPKFNLIAPLYKDKLFSGLEVQYLSPRKTLDNRHVGDATLVNLTLFTKNVVKGLEFSASAYNLLNQKIRDPGAGEHLQNGMRSIIQDGITFRLKLTYSY